MAAGKPCAPCALTKHSKGLQSPARASTLDAATVSTYAMDGNTPPSVLRLRGRLAAHYRRAKDTLDASMLPERASASVQDVQVNMVILPRRDLRGVFKEQGFASRHDAWRVEHVFSQAANTMKSTRLESLFSAARTTTDGDTFGVLAVASAGCGKTFVFTKVAPMQWALNQLWPETTVLSVRELRCKDVRKAPGLSKLLGLEGAGIEESRDRQEICDYIREHPEKLCLVLDGLDETSLSQCSDFVQKVIRGEFLQGIRLIVTSRPCADIFDLAMLELFQTQVELVGFRRGDVETYVRKVLRPAKASVLLEKVESEGYLSSMMMTPFIAKETCLVYHRDNFIPRCVADIFERLIVQVAERRSGHKFSNWHAIPKELRRLILGLGKFAFDMLTAQQLVFSEEDILEHDIGQDAVSLGLLVACDESLSIRATRQWRFSHLTMQECLAAKYQACHEPMTMSRIILLVESLGPESGHLYTFWVLLAAQLNANTVECLANSLLMRTKSREWHEGVRCKDFSVADPFPLNFIDPLCEVVSDVQVFNLAEQLLCTVEGGCGGKQLVEMELEKQGPPHSNLDFLRVLLQMWMDKVPEANAKTLLRSIKNVDGEIHRHCEGAVRERPCYVGPLDVHTDTNKWLRQDLVYQCFCEFVLHQEMECAPLPSIAAALKPPAGSLVLFDTDHPAKLRATDVVLRHHPSDLHSVKIYYWTAPHAHQLPSSLGDCSDIKELWVHECEAGLETISSAIFCSASKLRTIGFTAMRDPGMAVLLPAVFACRHLHSLSLLYCYMSVESGFSLAEMLSRMNVTSLSVFDLQRSAALGDDVITRICDALARCSRLSCLRLVDCGLTEVALGHITAALQHWPQLTELDVSGNNFSNVTARQLRRRASLPL